MSILMWCTTTGWIPQKQKSRSSPALLGGDNRWSYCWRQAVSVDVWFTPTSWTVLWLSLDGDFSSQFRISSDHVHVLRTFRLISKSGFLICSFPVREFNDQWKRMWCDMENVPLDAVLDKYGEPFCYFLSLYRVCACRSIPSKWHNARLLLMKARAQQMNEKHTAVTVEMYVLCCGVRGRWGKQENRQMTGANLTLSWFVQGVSGHENLIWILLLWTPVPSVKFVCVILFPCCMYVCMRVCLLMYQSRSPWNHFY